jgi:transketolase
MEHLALPRQASYSPVTYSSSYGQALLALASEREDVVVMVAQSPAPLRGLHKALGKRFIDVGLCDETLVGAAAGLAMRGRTPVVHASASVLTQRAFELVRGDVSAPKLPVTLVGFVPGSRPEASEPEGRSLDDLALMRAIPGMQVFCPADSEELREALPLVVASGRPAYVRYTAAEPALEHVERFAIGRAEVIASEDGVSILSCGPSLSVAEAARRLLAARGVPVRLVNLRSLEPVDEAALVDAVRPAELVVTLDGSLRRGGLYAILAETCLKHRLAPRVLPLSHECASGPSLAERILHAICETEEDARVDTPPGLDLGWP